MSDVIGEAIFPFTIGELVLAPADAIVPGETAEMWVAQSVIGGKLQCATGGYGNITKSLLKGSADAANFDLSAGQIRASELVAGSIKHALVVSVKNTKSTHVYPASSSDGVSENANAPAMGQRIYIAYTKAEIEALTVKPWLKTVLQALREYGAYVTDTGNYTMQFQFEGSEMFTSFGLSEPFSAIAVAESLPVEGGMYAFKFEEGVDWTKLRAIEHP
jgi:hypothetical protein